MSGVGDSATTETVETVWSLATKEVETQNERKKEEKLVSEERTILVTGAKQAGKTSLLLKFLEKSEERVKPSVALEYTFARKQRTNSLEKDIVNLWELAGGTNLTDLTDAVITAENLPGLSIVVIVDLSQPRTLWVTLEQLLNDTKEKIDKLVSSNKDLKMILEKSKNDRLQTFAKNFDHSNIFPVPLLIVGSKFDLYANLDSVEKKMIGRTLRFVAHHYGAHLVFVSERVASTLRYFKAFFNSLAFNTGMQKVISFDESKPIVISAGNDDSLAIGGPLTPDGTVIKDVYSWNDWKKHFCAFFAQKSLDSEQKNTDDPGLNPKYREPIIDQLKKQKFMEIENLRRKFRKEANTMYKVGAAS